MGLRRIFVCLPRLFRSSPPGKNRLPPLFSPSFPRSRFPSLSPHLILPRRSLTDDVTLPMAATPPSFAAGGGATRGASVTFPNSPNVRAAQQAGGPTQMAGRHATSSQAPDPYSQLKYLDSEHDQYDFDPVRDRLGRGAFSTVVSAWCRVHQQHVALKIVLKSRLTSHKLVDDLLREINLLHRFAHVSSSHSIVSLVGDACHTPMAVLIPMRLAPGVTLARHIAEFGCLDELTAALVVHHLTAAVCHLHEDLGIVHRDIKPENIVVGAYNNDHLAAASDHASMPADADDTAAGADGKFTLSLMLVDFGFARSFRRRARAIDSVDATFAIEAGCDAAVRAAAATDGDSPPLTSAQCSELTVVDSTTPAVTSSSKSMPQLQTAVGSSKSAAAVPTALGSDPSKSAQVALRAPSDGFALPQGAQAPSRARGATASSCSADFGGSLPVQNEDAVGDDADVAGHSSDLRDTAFGSSSSQAAMALDGESKNSDIRDARVTHTLCGTERYLPPEALAAWEAMGSSSHTRRNHHHDETMPLDGEGSQLAADDDQVDDGRHGMAAAVDTYSNGSVHAADVDADGATDDTAAAARFTWDSEADDGDEDDPPRSLPNSPGARGGRRRRAAGGHWASMESTVDHLCKLDAFAIGVVAYLCLTGCYPFNGTTKSLLLSQMVSIGPQFSSDAWREVTEEGRHFVETLLRADPDERSSVFRALRHPWFARHAIINRESAAS